MLGSGLLLGTGCAKTATTENGVLMHTDFDRLSGWVGDVPSLTRDKAHSGAYSIVVKPGLERSLGYDNTLSQLCDRRPTKIRLSAWILRTGSPPAAKLLVEIKNHEADTQLAGDSIDLGKEIRQPGTWQRVEHVLLVPQKASADSRLMVYMLGAGASQPTYLDDLTLSLVAE